MPLILNQLRSDRHSDTVKHANKGRDTSRYLVNLDHLSECLPKKTKAATTAKGKGGNVDEVMEWDIEVRRCTDNFQTDGATVALRIGSEENARSYKAWNKQKSCAKAASLDA